MRASESSESIREENYRKNANIISAVTFWYTLKIFKKGWKRDLTENDLTKPLNIHKSSKCGHKLTVLWSREVEKRRLTKKNPSFAKVLMKMFAFDIMKYGILIAIMELVFRVNQPLFLACLLNFFHPSNRKSLEDEEELCSPMYFERLFAFHSNQCPITLGEAYFFAGGILCCSFIAAIIVHPYLFAVMHVGMQMRVATCSLIYRKALRLNLQALSGETVGQAVNLMSNDVNRFDIVPLFYNYIWIGPLQVIYTVCFLWQEMGLSAVIGVTAILVFIPLQIWFGYSTAILRFRTAQRTDKRVSQMNEIIQAMQVIKMYAWEHAFSSIVSKSRKHEIKILKYTGFIKGMVMSFIMFTTRLAIFLTTLYYVIDGNEITAVKVFLVTGYYQVLRQTMTVYFPQGISQVAETIVAVGRIGKFLLLQESRVGDESPIDPEWKAKPHKVDRKKQQLKQSIVTIHTVLKVSISSAWAKYGKVVCLRDINLDAVPGQLTAVIGPVGSGKSCLLQLILGELTTFQGKVSQTGLMSYASQDPWLFAGSVRQNILFGRPYEGRKYREVIKICALDRDFMILPYGDKTIVGEKGVSLSGGQRARVNLARCVYKDADIYLLDDPLSAVDTHVGQEMFDNCILNYLKKLRKIIILVTHQLQYLHKADQIALMIDGRIRVKGNFHQVIDSGLEFSKVLAEAHDKSMLLVDEKQKPTKSLNMAKLEIDTKPDILDTDVKEVSEMRTVGSVGCYVYKEYFTAGGNWCTLFLLAIFFVSAQACASGSDYFLSKWVKLEEKRKWTKLTRQSCIIIYTILIIVTIILSVTRSFFFFYTCMKSSVTLHDRMFRSVIRASMRFFNTNTSGRILNRFSKDLGAIDEFLPNAMIDSTQILLNLFGTILVITVIAPILLIPTVALCIAFFLLRKYYLTTSRSVKRLEGITRSPIFAHLNASLQGLSTIRSNGAEMVLVSEFDRYQDIHSSAWFMFIATSRAFSYVLDLLCVLYMVTVVIYYLIQAFTANGAEVGLAVTQVIGLTGVFQWGMRQSAELENQMTSVERVLEFLKIEHEPSLESTPENKPPPSWPQHGQIILRNTSLYYDMDEAPVLKSLSIEFNAREKVGIVGRTGAGKSSIISALFRLAYLQGDIIIDNVNIKNIGLHDLRKKISIIPQEPVIFSGTLRYNLDPFEEYSDQAVFNALIVVEMQSAYMYGIDSLDTPMTEGGANLSVGERQMVCLARALLRRNIILIMDEATANMDAQTDKFIQMMIRTKFDHCTVITIAHRLNTIMDYDRVLVMDAGTSVEFDSPHILLQNSSGYLTAMVEKTGPKMTQHLRQVAERSYLEKQNQ